ncbi:hypothetical protein AB0T83_00015 [Fluviibacterium sp. DFM31]|uniref:ATP-binding protein n=1 Tax=Meridianimarinicoccus marinus TaxID=3231483 RepID=A0ABV3L0S5_9RHOB
MQRFSTSVVAATGILIGSMASAQELVWTVEGLDAPESAFYDDARDVLYVSNIAGGATEKNGKGYISRISPEGEVLDAQWVTGLDAPKGLVSDGSTLWVSDIDRLVAIDIESSQVSGTWAAADAQFLNDTAVAENGNVYVSDMIGQKIYVLADGEMSVLAEGDVLQNPNGLNMHDGKLLVAAWGQGLQNDFTTEIGGHLLTVDLDTGAVETLGSGAPIGNLDGLEPDGKGNWIVSDWIAGSVLRVGVDGSSEQIIDLDGGSADLEFIPDRALLVVPMMLSNTLLAYRVE